MWWLLLPVILYSAGLLVLRRYIVRREEDDYTGPAEMPAVSVIVAARNEADTITALLESLVLQDYPSDRLEIIIVNDNSTDRTPIAVSEFVASVSSRSGPRIKLIYNPFSGKKSAIRYGIEKSSGDIIITTDADCTVGPSWVRMHASWYFNERSGHVHSPHSGQTHSLHSEQIHSFHSRQIHSFHSRRIHSPHSERIHSPHSEQIHSPHSEQIHSPHSGQIHSVQAPEDRNRTAMVLAPVFQKSAYGFWSRFGVYEFSALQAITEATALAGHPVMCNAANMSFRREVYLRNVEELRPDLPSGDDMFLMQAVMRDGGAVRHDGRSAAAAETAAAVTAAALLRQRARWASKAFHYRDVRTITLAAATAACNAAVAAAAVIACVSVEYLPVVAAMYGVKAVPDYLLIAGEMKKRGGRVQVMQFTVSELIYPFYFVVVGVMSLFPSSRGFRGR